MKRTLFILTVLLFTYSCIAQTGWKWATGSTIHGNMYTEGTAVATDKNGDVYCAGFCDMYGTLSADTGRFGPFTINMGNSGVTQMFLTKVDASGNYQWMVNARGVGFTQPYSLSVDPAGNLLALASYTGTIVFGTDTLFDPNVQSEYALVKVSPEGTVLWAKNLTGRGAAPLAYTESVCTDGEGNIYVSGVFTYSVIAVGHDTVRNGSTVGYYNLFVTKLDSSGNVIWANGLQSTNDMPYGGMTVTKGGTVFLAGSYSGSLTYRGRTTIAPALSSPFVMKIDSNGTMGWLRAYNQSELNFTAITTDNKDRVYLAGYFQDAVTFGTATLTPPYPSGYHLFTACIDTSAGNIWACAAYDTTANLNAPCSIGVDRCGKVVVCSSIGGGIFPTPNEYVLFGTDTVRVPAGALDPLLVAVYDSAGNYLNSNMIAGGGEDWFGAQIDYRGNIYVCSDVESSSLAIGHDTLTASTGEAFFIAKYHYDDAVCPAEYTYVTPVAPHVRDISLYPNPAWGNCTIESSEPFAGNSRAELYDIAGRRIASYSLYGSKTIIPLSGIAPGVYFCRIISEDGVTINKKLVIE